MMFVLLGLHGVLAALLFGTSTALGKRGFLVAAAAPAATLIWLATQAPRVLDGRVTTAHLDWVPRLGLSIDLRLDGFSFLMALLVAGIGLLVLLYSHTYYSPTSEGLGRNAGLLLAFAAAMLIVVLADHLAVLYIGWELTSITSYLLIGNDHTKVHARAAALQALLITSFGGLAMLGGFVLIGQAAGTYRISELLSQPPTGTTVGVGVALVLLGAFTKSAQYPFASWLPGAMAAPTPVSAYLHSATMVKAGVYLVARFAPAFGALSMWRPVVLTVGLVTMIAGGLRALRQHDLKLLLAHGTVSQLGFLMVLVGTGTTGPATAGITMLLTHALFKAALFLAVGAVDRRTGTRDLRKIPALGAEWKLFKIAVVIVAASMAGLPPLLGFVAKEEAFTAMENARFGGHSLVLAGLVFGSALTVAYTARFLWGMFGRTIDRRATPNVAKRPNAPGIGFVAPLTALAALTLVLGLVPQLLNRLIGTAAHAVDPSAHTPHFALWHGFNLPLLLSVIAVAAGLAIHSTRPALEPLLRAGGRIPSGTAGYIGILRGVNHIATTVTGVVQNGSLPIYAGVTLLTAAAVPGIVLLTRTEWPGFPQFVESPAQVAVVGVVLAAAFAATLVRRRFSAALFLGTAGYAMAGLFVVQGAPDLALTQVAIETLSTVLFVLVLRRLPDRFERTSSRRFRIARGAIAALVGVTIFGLAVTSRAARVAEPVSNEMIEQSLPEGHGRNVVNVILVDIRGADTLGEIFVLGAAGIGAVALARAGRTRRSKGIVK